MIESEIANILGSYSKLVRPAFFIIFFSITAVVLYYHDRPELKKTYITVLIIAIILVNIIGIQMIPVTHFHKFSSPAPVEHTTYDIRIVDEHNEELLYDPRAAPPLTGARVDTLGERIVYDFNDQERNETARFLITKGDQHRDLIERSWLRTQQFQFPRHNNDYRWDKETLDQYGEFTGIKVYKKEMTFTSDGTEVESYNETLVYEWNKNEYKNNTNHRS